MVLVFDDDDEMLLVGLVFFLCVGFFVLGCVKCVKIFWGFWVVMIVFIDIEFEEMVGSFVMEEMIMGDFVIVFVLEGWVFFCVIKIDEF